MGKVVPIKPSAWARTFQTLAHPMQAIESAHATRELNQYILTQRDPYAAWLRIMTSERPVYYMCRKTNCIKDDVILFCDPRYLHVNFWKGINAETMLRVFQMYDKFIEKSGCEPNGSYFLPKQPNFAVLMEVSFCRPVIFALDAHPIFITKRLAEVQGEHYAEESMHFCSLRPEESEACN